MTHTVSLLWHTIVSTLSKVYPLDLHLLHLLQRYCTLCSCHVVYSIPKMEKWGQIVDVNKKWLCTTFGLIINHFLLNYLRKRNKSLEIRKSFARKCQFHEPLIFRIFSKWKCSKWALCMLQATSSMFIYNYNKFRNWVNYGCRADKNPQSFTVVQELIA